MGPTLLLDKCAFQSLSRQELQAMTPCFYINVPPILTLEILSDLKKKKGLMADGAHEVAVLSQKMMALCEAFHNAHYRFIAEGETQGFPVELRGVVAVSGGKRKTLPNGGVGVLIEEHPDRERFRRWASGTFTDEDDAHARRLREYTEALNIEPIRNDLWRRVKELPTPHPKSLHEVRASVDQHLHEMPQLQLLHNLFDILKLPEGKRATAVSIWQQRGVTSIRDQLPFSYHVLRTIHIYMIGLAYGLITNTPTNVLDLEYLFYLPFCSVFSTGDKFVEQMAEVLLTDRQILYHRNSLKLDMRAVFEVYEGEPSNRDAIEAQHRANGAFKHDVWRLNIVPWRRTSQNVAPHLSEETKARVLRNAKAMLS